MDAFREESMVKVFFKTIPKYLSEHVYTLDDSMRIANFTKKAD